MGSCWTRMDSEGHNDVQGRRGPDQRAIGARLASSCILLSEAKCGGSGPASGIPRAGMNAWLPGAAEPALLPTDHQNWATRLMGSILGPPVRLNIRPPLSVL